MDRDYEAMSADDLSSLNLQLSNQRDAIKQQQRTITRVLDRKLAEEEARQRIERMSDPERAALFQVVRADHLASSLKIGGQDGE
jgi:hypothetical protein